MLIKKQKIPIIKILTLGLLPSWLKIFLYRCKGASIGKNVRLKFGSIIISERIKIGHNTKLGYFTIIQSKSVDIGNITNIGMFVYLNVDRIHIGNDVTIRENNLFGGMDIGKSGLQIGDHSHIHQNCFINTTLPVKIGSNTAIGGGSYLFTHSSWQPVLEGYPCTFKAITIGDNVWIAWNTFILPGVEIGNNTLISASSTVTKTIPNNSLASGNPAKVLIPSGKYPRALANEERKEVILKILEEYKEYLIKNEISINSIEIEQGRVINILKGNKIIYRYIYIDTILNLKNLDKKNIIILCCKLDQNNKRELSNEKTPWIDLSNYEKYGSNDYMEELIAFLKHYGLRFKEFNA